jgi:hypothetical protein
MWLLRTAVRQHENHTASRVGALASLSRPSATVVGVSCVEVGPGLQRLLDLLHDETQVERGRLEPEGRAARWAGVVCGSIALGGVSWQMRLCTGEVRCNSRLRPSLPIRRLPLGRRQGRRRRFAGSRGS